MQKSHNRFRPYNNMYSDHAYKKPFMAFTDSVKSLFLIQANSFNCKL